MVSCSRSWSSCASGELRDRCPELQGQGEARQGLQLRKEFRSSAQGCHQRRRHLGQGRAEVQRWDHGRGWERERVWLPGIKNLERLPFKIERFNCPPKE